MKRSVCLLLLACAVGAAARDRPGTPVDQRVYQCHGYEGLPKRMNEGPPGICVIFTNTASEEVKFEVSVYKHGQRLALEYLRIRANCMAPSSEALSCTAGSNLRDDWPNNRPRYIKADNRRQHWRTEGLSIRDLEYDTTYCVRIKTRRKSDQVVSEVASSGPCVRTMKRPG